MNERGARAEQLAVDFLVDRGLEIVTRNYRCRGGEIDIVARDGGTLVFVEVRLRGSAAFGGPAASITAAKRRRLSFAARHYLGRLGREPDCRFDAILFSTLALDGATWLRDVTI